MSKIVVEVMLKEEILDPQGKAIINAMKRMDISGFKSVRQGKRFELEVDGDVTAAHLKKAHEAADKLLSNPVIESIVEVYEDTGSISKQIDTGIAKDKNGAFDEFADGNIDIARIAAASGVAASSDIAAASGFQMPSAAKADAGGSK